MLQAWNLPHVERKITFMQWMNVHVIIWKWISSWIRYILCWRKSVYLFKHQSAWKKWVFLSSFSKYRHFFFCSVLNKFMGVSNCGKGCFKSWDVLSNLPQYHYFCPSYSTIILATALQTTVICLLLLPSSSKSVWIARCADWLGAHAYASPFSCQMEINKYPPQKKEKGSHKCSFGAFLRVRETWSADTRNMAYKLEHSIVFFVFICLYQLLWEHNSFHCFYFKTF